KKRITLRESVERALRADDLQPRNLGQAVDHEVAASLVFRHHRCEKVLAGGQGLDGSSLGDRARIACALRLNLAHGGNQAFRAGGVTDAPSRHGVRFRDAVYQYAALAQLWASRAERHERSIVD